MASSIFGDSGGNSVLAQAASMIEKIGATDSAMEMAYRTIPQVRQIVDRNGGPGNIADAMRSHGIDPDEAMRSLGINR